MESLLTFAFGLVFQPVLGGTALCLVAAVWETATAQTTPKWEQYLWFLGAGYVLLNLREVMQMLASGAGLE
jgi:predicted phage tail protein